MTILKTYGRRKRNHRRLLLRLRSTDAAAAAAAAVQAVAAEPVGAALARPLAVAVLFHFGVRFQSFGQTIGGIVFVHPFIWPRSALSTFNKDDSSELANQWGRPASYKVDATICVLQRGRNEGFLLHNANDFDVFFYLRLKYTTSVCWPISEVDLRPTRWTQRVFTTPMIWNVSNC